MIWWLLLTFFIGAIGGAIVIAFVYEAANTRQVRERKRLIGILNGRR